MGSECYENWFFGANRSGKSDVAAAAGAKLARFGLPNPRISPCGDGVDIFDRATSGWVISQTFPASRDIVQPKLFNNGFGAPGAHPPFIPEREIEKWSNEAQVLKLKNGSLIGFKSCITGSGTTMTHAGVEKDWAMFDEEPIEKVYDEVVIRVGSGRRLRIFGACTLVPDDRNRGVSWMFSRFIKPWNKGTLKNARLFSSSIYDNPFIAKEEITNLEYRFPPGTLMHRIRLLGELVDEFTGARAYSLFSTKIHVKPQEYSIHHPLIWTWDFNVEPSVSLICQNTGGVFRVLQELVLEVGTLFDMVAFFKQKVPLHGAEVYIYGDATGNNRTDQTGKSNYTIMRELMQNYPSPVTFKIPASNPTDIHRINAINRLLQVPVSGEVKLLIDPSCDETISDLEQVVLNNKGGIKKVYNRRDSYSKRTHTSDALGYWLANAAPTVESLIHSQSNNYIKPKCPSYGSRKASSMSSVW